MKLFTTKQITQLDKYTIENEPIADLDLMERASLQISGWIVQRYSTEQKMVFFAGTGNNGGDALAIARQLADLDYLCEVYLPDFGKKYSESSEINLKRLKDQGKVKINFPDSINRFPELKKTDIIFEGLFGSGLTKPLQGFAAEIVYKINQLSNTVIAIDIPGGLFGEDNTGNEPEAIIRANYTLTFQFPKVSFLFPENERFTGSWHTLPIGLLKDGINEIPSNYYFIEKEDVCEQFPARKRFSHKGDFGHALLIAGSYGKMGASVLASKACLKAGTGLLTTHVPKKGYSIIQTSVPETMASVDKSKKYFSEVPDLSAFNAIAVGPGIGQSNKTKKALINLIENSKVPLVLDADALNILAEDKTGFEKLPHYSILTPHPGEFRRIIGETSNSYDKLVKQIKFAEKYKVIIVLKGAYTTITTPEGKVYFNSTGNPGMATAGSGDVLTGIILGLLAQGLKPEKAAVTGVYIHGLAGDLAAEEKSEPAMLAGDIIENLGKAFISLNQPLSLTS